MDMFDADPAIYETEATANPEVPDDDPVLSMDEMFAMEEDAAASSGDGELVTETPEETDTVRIPVTIKHEI